MGSLGPFEIILILLVVLLLFGAKRIPEIARGLGKGIREFKDATNDIKREIALSDTPPAQIPPSAPYGQAQPHAPGTYAAPPAPPHAVPVAPPAGGMAATPPPSPAVPPASPAADERPPSA